VKRGEAGFLTAFLMVVLCCGGMEQKFSPLFQSASMRDRLTDGHPESPLLLYVGRLGAEKKLKTLRYVRLRYI
jgi:hypothetical protein